MKLTSEMLKAKAKELGIDCIAIGNIERFKNAPKLMSPISYFPKAKSVIAIAMPFLEAPTGALRKVPIGITIHSILTISSTPFFAPSKPINCPVSLRIAVMRRWRIIPLCPKATAPQESR